MPPNQIIVQCLIKLLQQATMHQVIPMEHPQIPMEPPNRLIMLQVIPMELPQIPMEPPNHPIMRQNPLTIHQSPHTMLQNRLITHRATHMEPQNHPIMHQVIHTELHHRTKPLSLLTMLQSHHTIPLLPGKRFFSLSVPLLNYGQLFGHTVQNEIYYMKVIMFGD